MSTFDFTFFLSDAQSIFSTVSPEDAMSIAHHMFRQIPDGSIVDLSRDFICVYLVAQNGFGLEYVGTGFYLSMQTLRKEIEIIDMHSASGEFAHHISKSTIINPFDPGQLECVSILLPHPDCTDATDPKSGRYSIGMTAADLPDLRAYIFGLNETDAVSNAIHMLDTTMFNTAGVEFVAEQVRPGEFGVWIKGIHKSAFSTQFVKVLLSHQALSWETMRMGHLLALFRDRCRIADAEFATLSGTTSAMLSY